MRRPERSCAASTPSTDRSSRASAPTAARSSRGGQDGAVRILDAYDQRAPALAVLRGHRGVRRRCPLQSGRSTGAERGPGRHRATLGTAGAPVVLRAPVTDATFSPDGRRIIAAGEDGTVRIWSAAGGPDSANPRRRSADPLSAVAVAPNGRLDRDRRRRRRRARVALEAAHFVAAARRQVAGAITSLAFSPDSRRVVSTSDDGRVLVWTPPNPRPVVVARSRLAIYDAASRADGRRVVVAGEDGCSPSGDREGLARHGPLRGHRGAVILGGVQPGWADGGERRCGRDRATLDGRGPRAEW